MHTYTENCLMSNMAKRQCYHNWLEAIVAQTLHCYHNIKEQWQILHMFDWISGLMDTGIDTLNSHNQSGHSPDPFDTVP